MALLNETSVAEDIVHDVFISFIRSAEQFQLTGSLKSYLATCIVNRVRNINQAKRRRKTVGLDKAGTIASDLKRPDQWITCSEELTKLCKAWYSFPITRERQ